MKIYETELQELIEKRERIETTDPYMGVGMAQDNFDDLLAITQKLQDVVQGECEDFAEHLKMFESHGIEIGDEHGGHSIGKLIEDVLMERQTLTNEILAMKQAVYIP